MTKDKRRKDTRSHEVLSYNGRAVHEEEISLSEHSKSHEITRYKHDHMKTTLRFLPTFEFDYICFVVVIVIFPASTIGGTR